MHQTILVNTNINKSTKVGNVGERGSNLYLDNCNR